MGEAMTDEMIDLGRRAVACKGWRWMPGMLADLTTPEYKPARVLSVQSGGYEPPMLEIAWSWDDGDGVHPRGWLPDLTDPATLGCLLALVREAWGCPVWVSLDVEPDAFDALDDSEYVLCEPLRWTVWRAPDGDYVQPCGSGPTEAAALVAALEAAP